MFDAMKLLEQMLGPQTAATAQSYIDQGGKTVENLVGAENLAKGKALLGEGLSSLEAKATEVIGEDKMAQMKGLVENQGQGLAIGAVAGGLLGLIVGTETGRKVGGTVATIGSLAALGGLAWKAMQSAQAPDAPAASPAAPVALEPPAATVEAQQKLAAATIVAMIQAAKADGHVDEAERAAILAKVGPIEGAAKAFLDTELAAPLDLDRVAGLAGAPNEAAHLYAASLLAIDPDQTAEKAYLEALADKLGLDAGVVAEITRRVKGA
ncbi:MAG: tellurite resistance TerB family protein [Phyllobacteriaceae bacterium]|nr:tellurite resistance TerB family protein [Phyllobacteriaceae bacterium]